MDLARHRLAVAGRLEQAARAGRLTRSGPGSVTWRINREVAVVAGWGRAILLQLAHPLIAAAVAEHSTFRGTPLAAFRRLFSTIQAMLSLTFGDDDDVVEAAARINVIHDRVFGRLPGGSRVFPPGTPYSAHDAELLRWVHVTLLDSLPRAYELLVGSLSSAERDRYCAETVGMEPLLGMPPGTLPARLPDLSLYMREMLDGGKLEVTDTARTLAQAMLHPPLSTVLWPAFRPVRLITVGLLPPAVRDAYGFPWTPRDERALVRWVAGIHLVRRALPPVLCEWPVARRAEWTRQIDPVSPAGG